MFDIQPAVKKGSENVEMNDPKKHGCSTGSSTPNPLINTLEALSTFFDFFYIMC